MKYYLLIFAVVLVTIGVAASEGLMLKAKELAKKLLIIDAHIDAPLQLNRGQDLSVLSEKGNFDYPRAVEGGLNVAFMAVYISPGFQGTPKAKETADKLIELVEQTAASYPDKFMMIRSTADVLGNYSTDRVMLAMGMENGAPIENFDLLKYYHNKGIRYVTLTHGKCNNICDSSYDEERKWHGLSPFGKGLIKEMNKVGMMIDISHVSDETFYQVIELSEVPVIASHSSCRHFTPGFERNMSDEMIKILADKGGVIQINFGSDFIDQDYRSRKSEYRKSVDKFVEEHKLPKDDPQVENYRNEYQQKHPVGYSTVQKVADHIDHVKNLVGVDYIGLGSDFDGVGDTLPTGLKDVSMYPNLIYELLKRGYTESDIEKICSKNLMRVWKQVEDFASQK
ncbi:MAG: dipeptidase [Melioribacteraceae bacterium]|nr:dipeptidase [Melioribacteraceae bacterium]